MARLVASGRIAGLDTARGIAILGMIATHLYPLLMTDVTGQVTPTWVGLSLTGVSSALFVVLAGVGLSLLTRHSTSPARSRLQLSIRAIVLIFIGLLLGQIGSNVAIILVHYGVMFLIVMWFIRLSSKVLTITAVTWIVAAPWLHGVLTRFLHVQAGGTTAYVNDWRLWTSPTLTDVLARPLVTLWDVFFTGYYPVISFLGYVLVGMAIGRLNLRSAWAATSLFIGGALTYVACRGLAAWFLTDAEFAYRIGHATGTDEHALAAMAATGSQINTDLVMGAPQWFGLAVPHSGAPLDIYSTAGAALAVIGLCLLITRLRFLNLAIMPVTATGMIALTAYTAHVALTAVWPRTWPSMVPVGDPVWESIWWMVIAHWALVMVLGLVAYSLSVRGPLESLLRRISTVTARD